MGTYDTTNLILKRFGQSSFCLSCGISFQWAQSRENKAGLSNVGELFYSAEGYGIHEKS